MYFQLSVQFSINVCEDHANIRDLQRIPRSWESKWIQFKARPFPISKTKSVSFVEIHSRILFLFPVNIFFLCLLLPYFQLSYIKDTFGVPEIKRQSDLIHSEMNSRLEIEVRLLRIILPWLIFSSCLSLYSVKPHEGSSCGNGFGKIPGITG
jgi:hypothetical protein